jgi:IS4 transposase
MLSLMSMSVPSINPEALERHDCVTQLADALRFLSDRADSTHHRIPRQRSQHFGPGTRHDRRWRSGGGLGLGLPGARRLVHEFTIESSASSGTSRTHSLEVISRICGGKERDHRGSGVQRGEITV